MFTVNLRQTKFVAEYLKTGNATKSAIKAGYSKKTAYSIGEQLLRKLEISQKVEDLKAKATSSAVLTVAERKEMLSEAARQARAGLTPYLTSCTPDGDLSFDVNPDNINGELEMLEQHIRPAPEGSGDADTVVRKLKVRPFLPYIQELNKMDGSYAPEKSEMELKGDVVTEALADIRQRREARKKAAVR